MKCSRCGKKLTAEMSKITLGNKILCILCYQKIPYKEKMKILKKGD
ncbi:hypothetical protein Cdeb_00327 [Caldibacillus debilis GB1]|uniref:Uncharacterized protein n=1 Tax=Caldibacillus debilis GB1 TaxID=1339248 RepID=A0A420VI07_9BACI|nr:hypothetical protein Cdeb_00327 [Caldibacillus debilis GB1]